MSNLNAPVEEICSECDCEIHEGEGRYRYASSVVKCEKCGDKSPIIDFDGFI